jgi:DNA-binding transcriptional MerR regulator
MKIGELVKRTHVPKETIHYYIRKGLLRKPRKTGKNTADYSESYVDQLRLIRELQDNYFLPLSIIKKIIKEQRKQSIADQSSFKFQAGLIRPIDRLMCTEIKGKDAFMEATGIGRKWLNRMEEWGVITAENQEGEAIYSQDDVIIGKLIVDMDRLGLGPKDGYDPEGLRHFTDLFRKFVMPGVRDYFNTNLEKIASDEFSEKGSQYTEVMSLFFYHIYRKLAREERNRILKSFETDGSESKAN